MKSVQHCIHLISNRNDIVNTVVGISLQAKLNGENNLCIKRQGSDNRTCSPIVNKLLVVADDETVKELEQLHAYYSIDHSYDEIFYVLASAKPQLERKGVLIVKPEDLRDVIDAFYPSLPFETNSVG